jgi:hypothetical protein
MLKTLFATFSNRSLTWSKQVVQNNNTSAHQLPELFGADLQLQNTPCSVLRLYLNKP